MRGRGQGAGRPPRGRLEDHLGLAVGTTAGLFFISDGVVDGPQFPGERVSAFTELREDTYLTAIHEPSGRPRIAMSENGGVTWTAIDPGGLAIDGELGRRADEILFLGLDQDRPDGVLLVGTAPAALLASADRGASFSLLPGLPRPAPDSAERCAVGRNGLHTVLRDPERPGHLLVGLAPGGVYRSEDGGQTFEAANKGIEPAAAEGSPCVHALGVDAAGADVLWARGHTGVFRSDDGASTWQEVGRSGQPAGLPTGFGAALVTHPSDAGTAYCFPLESDHFPYAPAGRPAIWRTEDAGKRWVAYSSGLPQVAAFLSVGPGALSIGPQFPYPVVLGTASGEIYGSVDGGEHWRSIVRYLPPVLSVRVLS